MRKTLGFAVLMLAVGSAIWSFAGLRNTRGLGHEAVAADMAANSITRRPENKPTSGEGRKWSDDPTWHYLTTSDTLTDQPIKGAIIFSTNRADFAWPYGGGSNLSLALRRRGGHTDAMLVISKGQFVCDPEGCELGFRFDDGPVETIKAFPSSAGKSDEVFVRNAQPLLRRLQQVHHLRIAATFYDNGRCTFDFSTGGLDPHQLD